jgi:hypothetical protein
MQGIYLILFLLTIFSLSCRNEKDPVPSAAPVAIDHVRWGSKKNPLQNVVISWRSKGLEDKIKWGYSDQHENGEFTVAADIDFVGSSIKYEFQFDSLIPSSIIHYRLFDSQNNTWTDDKIFKTAPPAGSNRFKFNAGGDSRTNIDDWHLVSEAIETCDFSLFLGDLTISGSDDAAWENWYSNGVKFLSNNLVFYTRGGHDVGDNYNNNIVNPGNRLYYFFEFGNSVFISLDVSVPDSWDEQANFLEETLKSNQSKTWKFVFFHAPFFTSQVHVGEMDALRSTWWKIMDDYGVDFVFNGHEHSYMRSVPVNLNISDTNGVSEYGGGPGQGRCQIIAGQYGAPAYAKNQGWFVAEASVRLHYTTVEVNNSQLVFKAIDALSGEIFDSLYLRK